MRFITQRFAPSLPPPNSPHWLQWRHVSVGAGCVILTAVILTACLSDFLDSGLILPPEPRLNPDYEAMYLPSLPFPRHLRPTIDLNEMVFEDDSALEHELHSEHDVELKVGTSGRIVGERDQNGFWRPQFNLVDWYLHAQATDKKYRWALSKYNHWKSTPSRTELGRLRILDEYIMNGVHAFPDPRASGCVTAQDIWRWQAGIKLFKGAKVSRIIIYLLEMSRESAKLEYCRLTRDLLFRYGDIDDSL